MWEVDNICYRNENSFDRAFVGAELVWYPKDRGSNYISIETREGYTDATYGKLKKGVNIVQQNSDRINFRNNTNVVSVDFLNYQTTTPLILTMAFSFSKIREFKADIANLEYVQSCENMFTSADELVSAKFPDLPNCTSFNQMFYDAIGLENVSLGNTPNVTNISSMFHNCVSLAEAPYFDMSKVTNADYMFFGCSWLRKIPKYNISSLRPSSRMFEMAYRIEELEGLVGLKYSMDFSASEYITRESVMNIVREADEPSDENGQLHFSQTVIDRLTVEDISYATSKGWIISA